MDQSETIDHKEAERRVRIFRWIVLSLIGLIILGSIFYHIVEGWSWLDATYFSVVSLATVGYGDLTPQTDIGKLFTMVYLLVGLGIFAAFINNIAKSRVAKRSLKHDALVEKNNNS